MGAVCLMLVDRCEHCAEPRHRHFDHAHVERCPFGDCGPKNYLAAHCAKPMPCGDHPAPSGATEVGE